MRILLVEDDETISSLLKRSLESQHYSVDVADDGMAGEDMAWSNDYDLIVLDIMLPKKDGLTLARDLRKQGVKAPILMLTAMGTPTNVVAGLDIGADDYIVKPFDLPVLLARIRSLIRRHSEHRTSDITIGDLVIDTARRTAERAGRSIVLTSKVYALLEYLAMNKGRVVSRDEIIEHVWNDDFDPHSNVIESLVHTLRQRVDRGFERPLIRTIRGTGYVLGD